MTRCPREEEVLMSSVPDSTKLQEHIRSCPSCRAVSAMVVMLKKWKQEDSMRAQLPLYTRVLLQGEWRAEENRRRKLVHSQRWKAAGIMSVVVAAISAVDGNVLFSILRLWDMIQGGWHVIVPMALYSLVSACLLSRVAR